MGRAAILFVVALVATVPSAAARPPLAGEGPLEWKPDGRMHLQVTGPPAALGFPGQSARVGNVVITSGIYRIGNAPRHGVAAFDLRTRKALPFNPDLPLSDSPEGAAFQFLTASSSAVYVLYEDQSGMKLRAFDLATSRELPGFDSSAIEGSDPVSLVYADGKLIVAGNGEPGLAGYDARTGARIWAQSAPGGELGISSFNGMVTDGEHVYVGGPNESQLPAIAAFNVADGNEVPGWGASLPKGNGVVYGLSGSKVFGGRGAAETFRRVIATAATGAPVTLPRLPKSTGELFSGTGRTIVGRYFAPTHSQPAVVLVYGIFADPSGRRLGTVSGMFTVFVQIDDRHLLADQDTSNGKHFIIELSRRR
jgi:hypothetical protein